MCRVPCPIANHLWVWPSSHWIVLLVAKRALVIGTDTEPSVLRGLVVRRQIASRCSGIPARLRCTGALINGLMKSAASAHVRTSLDPCRAIALVTQDG